jgi:Tfp pilus assembly protein FimT
MALLRPAGFSHGRSVGPETGFTAIGMVTTVAIVALVGAFAAPLMGNLLGDYRLSGDARGISNAIALAKTHVASDFTDRRLYVDLGAKTYHVEVWQKTGAAGWVAEGGVTALASQDGFNFGAVSSAPPNTQDTIGQPAACLDRARAPIAQTACVLLNSRGLPVDASGALIGQAVYLTDKTSVYSVSVTPTGTIQTWRTPATGASAWSLH